MIDNTQFLFEQEQKEWNEMMNRIKSTTENFWLFISTAVIMTAAIIEYAV